MDLSRTPFRGLAVASSKCEELLAILFHWIFLLKASFYEYPNRPFPECFDFGKEATARKRGARSCCKESQIRQGRTRPWQSLVAASIRRMKREVHPSPLPFFCKHPSLNRRITQSLRSLNVLSRQSQVYVDIWVTPPNFHQPRCR